MRRGSIVRLVIYGVLSGIAASLVAVLVPWLPTSASEEMDRIEFVFWFTTVICVAIFAIVSAVIIYAVRKFRAAPEDDTDGPPIHGHTGIEIVWTAVPAVLVTAISVVSAIVLAQNEDLGPNPLRISVTAQQFAWRFEYPGEPPVTSGALVLPVDQGVKLTLHSLDVIHSFWVPEFGQKSDAVPGIETTLAITPTRLGSYSLLCTELCGLGHSTMRAAVRVVSREDYEAFLASERDGGGADGGGDSDDGESVFATAGCGSCHAFAPAGSDFEVGPGLDDLAGAAEGAGQPLEEFIRESIVDPNARLAEGYQAGVMPSTYDTSLSDDQLDGLVQYLVDGQANGVSDQVTELHDEAHAPHGSPGSRPRSALRRFTGPGYLRTAWVMPLFSAFGFALVVFFRWLGGYDPTVDWAVVTVVAFLTTAPIGFLAGIGAFDYWVYYVTGRPTRPEDHSSHGATSWRDYFRVNTDHKVIGVQYLVTVFFFFVVAGLAAMLFRAELAQPDLQFVDPQAYNGLISVHAALMIFLFIIPAFAGLANFAVPLMLGAPDMAFPRLNALSFWLLPVAGIMMIASFLAPGGAFATGWTSYAPLASEQPLGQVFFNMGVQWAGASSIMTALNFLVTIITMRAPGMTFWRMPLLVWANFTTSLLVVIATPFIAASQFFVMFDRIMHTNFFTVAEGGYVLAYQHIFWFYSHPAVYIMILPGFGIISEVIAVFSRKPVFGYRLMALSLMAILVLGFSVWAHHMFVAGMAPWLRVPMMVTSMIIAVPTGVKVFSWLATMWEGKIHFKTPMLFAVGFVSMFVLGGLSGIFLASVPIDIAASDTYFIVAHIHYVLFGGSLFTIFAGIYYWFPKMTGRMYNERLGKLHFWLTFVGFNGTFFPMHWIGLQGMPRRVADYAAEFGNWNLVITMFSFLLGASTIVFFYNMIQSWARGPIAGSNPWRAMTLEWQVSSPPPIFNFDEIPQVVGGPYEYGVPGARHAVLNGDRAPAATTREEETVG